MEHLGVDLNFPTLQKACLFWTVRILRRVLDTWSCQMQLAIQLKLPVKDLTLSNMNKILFNNSNNNNDDNNNNNHLSLSRFSRVQFLDKKSRRLQIKLNFNTWNQILVLGECGKLEYLPGGKPYRAENQEPQPINNSESLIKPRSYRWHANALIHASTWILKNRHGLVYWLRCCIFPNIFWFCLQCLITMLCI